MDKKKEKRARELAPWGALLPQEEQRLQIKGGWVHQSTGRSLGRPAEGKENRALELHNYGFA